MFNGFYQGNSPGNRHTGLREPGFRSGSSSLALTVHRNQPFPADPSQTFTKSSRKSIFR